jgi:hypothetical protein
MAAIKEYNDRAYGKAYQSVAVTNDKRDEPMLDDYRRSAGSAVRPSENQAFESGRKSR